MTPPKEVPILFSTPMVVAIQERTKDQTRRVLKHQPIPQPKLPMPLNEYACFIAQKGKEGYKVIHTDGPLSGMLSSGAKAKPGDVFWVRERWGHALEYCIYKADEPDIPYDFLPEKGWKPSIHMPKIAARLWLPIVEVRFERLQDISEQDAINEGILRRKCPTTGIQQYYHYTKDKWGHSPIHSFQTLWESINGPDSWQVNPWVAVYRWAMLPSYTQQEALDYLATQNTPQI